MFKKSLLWVSALFVSALLMTPQSFAQEPKAAKNSVSGVFFAVLDVDAVLKQSKAVKNIHEQIAKYQAEIQKGVDADNKTLKEEEAELVRKRNLQTDDQFQVERKKFQKRVAGVQRNIQERGQKLTQVRLKAMSKVDEALRIVIEGIVKTNQITILLDKRSTIMSNVELDISGLVLNGLDAKLPSVLVDNPLKK
ncbi:MAG: OmpH family outer membrane protein [Magnetovibrio sp.]|nr:OmpH family outer membrane protein [Magnetovibrio sp.]